MQAYEYVGGVIRFSLVCSDGKGALYDGNWLSCMTTCSCASYIVCEEGAYIHS